MHPLRLLPLWAFLPLRWAVARLRRRNPLRAAAILVLRQARQATTGTLSRRLSSVVPLDHPDLSFEPVDSMVMDAVFWMGLRGYEGKVADIWVELCRDARSVLEIGGNVGLFTVIGARAGSAAYVVVEPVPSLTGTLRRNLARNGVEHVTILTAAAIPGALAGPVVLSIPGDSRGAPVDAFLADLSEVTDRDRSHTITVPGIPIAELVQGHDLIKIDAEGVEAELIEAVRGWLVRTRPTLMIEVLPDSERLGRLLARLAIAAGYEIIVIPEWGSDDPVTIDPARFDSTVPARHNSKDVLLRVPRPG